MRETKFRDYNHDTKELRYFDLDHYDKEEHDAWGNLMQYTGLKDKNGVEIYEGDILEHYVDMHITQEELEQNGGKKPAPYKHLKVASMKLTPHHSMSYDMYANHEVIGNIWENGDLLNDKSS